MEAARRILAMTGPDRLRLAVALSAFALLASATTFAAAPPTEEEILDEVTVSGARPTRQPSEIMLWMRRLPGQFAWEGHVDLRGQGDPEDLRPVSGQADCVGFGPVPAVNCDVRARWPEAVAPDGSALPGGVSNLDPAMILYGFEPDMVGVRWMLVDSKGVAEPAFGLLVGNTLYSRTNCVKTPGNCQRTVRITAKPDLKMVEIDIDIDQDFRKVLAYHFVLRRVPPPPDAPQE